MNREELRAQYQAAATRLTDEIVGYFVEMLQSTLNDLTVGSVYDGPPAAAVPVPEKLPAVPAVETDEKPAEPVAAVSADGTPLPPAPRKRGRPRGSTNKNPSAKALAAQRRSAKGNSKAGRRSNKEIDKAAEKVEALLRRTKVEMRIEEINKELNTITRDLMRPIKMLLTAGKIQRRGERRSTTYSAV